MKTKALLTISALFLGVHLAGAQGTTAFTYQGRLNDTNGPANGTYDFQSLLCTNGSSGPPLAGFVAVNAGVVVSNGLFTMQVQFLPTPPFAALALWLELSVRTSGGGSYTTLSPRQRLTPTPYAVYSASAGNATSAGSFSGALAGDVRGTQGATTVGGIRGVNVSLIEPLPNQHLRFDGGNWAPGAVALGTDVSGTLPVASGGTGAGNAAQAVANLGAASLAANNSFTASNVFVGVVTATNTSNQIAGTFSGSGAGLTGLNLSNSVTTIALQNNAVTAAKIASGNVVKSLNGLKDDLAINAGSNVTVAVAGTNIFISASSPAVPSAWLLAGNAGTTAGVNFLGTTDNQPLELKANGLRALRVEPAAFSPNLTGGSRSNSIASGLNGAVIAGGGDDTVVGRGNVISNTGWFSFIGAGVANRIETIHSVVGGGFDNELLQGGGFNGSPSSSGYSLIAGGQYNRVANSYLGTLGGGDANWLRNSMASFVGGGSHNRVGDVGLPTTYGAIAGGMSNVVTADAAFIGSGQFNTAIGVNSAIGGGLHNTISNNSENAVIGGGQNNLVNDYCDHATIAGGSANTISNSHYATISGGQLNTLDRQADHSTIGGGQRNSIGHYSFDATIAGGYFNSIGEFAQRGSIGGGNANQVLLSASYAHIGGGSGNTVSGRLAAIAGGERNEASSEYAAVLGGSNNIAGAPFATVGGGWSNRASGSYSAVVGGLRNEARGQGSVIGGGGGVASPNVVYGDFSAVLGGWDMVVRGQSAVAVGGGNQSANGNHSMVLGGRWNEANGDFSFASGTAAKADHGGAFVWADSAKGTTNILGTNYVLWPFEFRSTNQNEFAVRATGGARFVSGIETNGTPKFGVVLYPNATSWASISDRNAKTGFQPVDSKAVLEKLAQVPVQHWHYKGEDGQAPPHLGPMAQDFKAAFYPGRDDKTITTLEFDGVELAAIQGLNQKLEESNRQLQESLKAKDELLTDLARRMAELERRLPERSGR